ncbi:unnamed protein product [Rodentolepis nana]|uniref:Uncharacterized protein n=1 Tax=Rodentolepis nana TaxID=102285 RepID=A0A0R3TUY7_RODNA|nr:unnamed protein product [Rodentolepis nana]
MFSWSFKSNDHQRYVTAEKDQMYENRYLNLIRINPDLAEIEEETTKSSEVDVNPIIHDVAEVEEETTPIKEMEEETTTSSEVEEVTTPIKEIEEMTSKSKGKDECEMTVFGTVTH